MALKKHKASFFLVFLFFLVYFFSFPASLAAQNSSSLLVSTNLESPADLFSCNDFYNEKDFNFFVSQSPKEALPGHTYTINGWIENHRRTFLPNATLYIKIKKTDTSESLERVESYTVVAKELNISELDKMPVSYSWDVPLGVPDGIYIADMFLTIGSDHVRIPVSADNIKITVNSGNKQKLPIVLTSAKTTLSKDLSRESVNLVFSNNQSKIDAIPVLIKMYKGDFARGVPVETINKVVDFSKGGSSVLTFDITNYKFAKKTFVVEYPSEDQLKNMYMFYSGDKTIKDPLLKLTGFADLKKIPVVYTCAESLNFDKITRTKLELKVFDKENNIIKQIFRERIATSSEGAIKIDLNSDDVRKMVNGARIESNLFVNNVLKDSILINYDCKDSKNIVCNGRGDENKSRSNINYWDILITLGVLAVLLWAISFLAYKKIKKGRVNFLLLFIAIGGLMTAPSVATADWRTDLKGFAGAGNPLVLAYEFDKIFGGYFHSDYEFNYCVPFDNKDCTTYQNGLGYGSGTVYWGPMSDPPTLFNQSVVPAYVAQIPIRIGVIVLNDSQFSADNYTFSLTSSGLVATNLTLINDNPSPANWSVPIGTHVGFYINPRYDSGFFWNSPGWIDWSFYGTLVDTLPTALSGCYSDKYNGNIEYPQTYKTCPVNLNSPLDFFSLAFRVIYPTVTIQGLDNFDCEVMQSDGTMECVAARLGPSTPYVVVGDIQGRLYGASSFGVYKTGDCRYNASGSCRFPDGTYSPYYLGNQVVPSPSPLTVTNGSTASFNNPYSNDPNLVGRALTTTLSDGQAGILLPSRTFEPFGQVTVVPAYVAPTAPAVTTLDTYTYGGYPSFLFEAVGTDSDSRISYQIDWNNDGNYDGAVNLTNSYYNSTSSQAVEQTGYVDPWTYYAPSGSPLRFNGTFYDTGTLSFGVRTIDEQGLTSDWTTHSVFIPTPPAPVDTFNADASSSCGQGIDLSWNNVSGIDGYYIYRYNLEIWDYEKIATIPAGTLTYNDSTVTYPDYGDYMIRTYSSNMVSSDAYNGAYGAQACVTVNPPTNFVAVADPDTCGGKINLTWTAATGTGVSGYNLHRLNNISGIWESISNTTGTSYNDTVVPGETTYYRIRSRNYSNTSFSSWVSISPGVVGSASCNGVPTAPTNLSANTSNSCGGKIDFTWSASSSNNATGYYLYMYDSLTQEYRRVATITNGTSYTYTQGDGNSRTYVVSGYNIHGESAEYSNIVMATPSTTVCNPECSDGADNDTDGATDASDTGCLLNNAYNQNDDLEQDNACLRDGVIVNNTQSRVFYMKKLIPQGNVCDNYLVDADGDTAIDDQNDKLLTCRDGLFYDESQVPDFGNSDPNGKAVGQDRKITASSVLVPDNQYPYATCRANVNFQEK